ncbi:hypothetical protein CHX27_04745 [Flavobacterium aurantiibacter]|uniref:Uncharacterized protein n=1 Tax=Flavobacterium aurantiibacter TaxID=2023067 RepID=A0A255ZXZ0_9FLAO|nr:hypothetical protein CHX27_04745 [Flavobacterium aurantiibacter]
MYGGTRNFQSKRAVTFFFIKRMQFIDRTNRFVDKIQSYLKRIIEIYELNQRLDLQELIFLTLFSFFDILRGYDFVETDFAALIAWKARR